MRRYRGIRFAEKLHWQDWTKQNPQLAQLMKEKERVDRKRTLLQSLRLAIPGAIESMKICERLIKELENGRDEVIETNYVDGTIKELREDMKTERDLILLAGKLEQFLGRMF